MSTLTDSQLASIHKMLNPRSIAVAGATPRLQYGGRFLAALLERIGRLALAPG
jgi:acyl-CoA synthetase (NDP forming)